MQVAAQFGLAVADCKPAMGCYFVSVLGYVPTRAMFGTAGREASDEFLRMTEHPSRPTAQLSGDGRANIKYPECQTIQRETSRKWQTDT